MNKPLLSLAHEIKKFTLFALSTLSLTPAIQAANGGNGRHGEIQIRKVFRFMLAWIPCLQRANEKQVIEHIKEYFRDEDSEEGNAKFRNGRRKPEHHI